MKILQIIKEEVVPLSSRQHLVLLIIIACVFQFVLFYAPALADEAVKQGEIADNAQEMMITGDLIVKDLNMDQEAAKLTRPYLPQSPDKKSESDSTPAIELEKIKITKTSTHTITAYNSDAAQTDDSPCTTANGFNVCVHGEEDTIAANFLPFGTKVMIPDLFGDRVFIVRDRMNKRHNERVDVWMKNHNDAIRFGVKVAKIQVIE